MADIELSREQDMQISNKDRDGTGLPATENYSAWTAKKMLRPELSSPCGNFCQKSREPNVSSQAMPAESRSKRMSQLWKTFSGAGINNNV